MPFAPLDPMVHVEPDGRTFSLAETVAYDGKDERFVIPAEFSTDFASIPAVVEWAIPKLGAYTQAAIVHDWFCVELAKAHRSPTTYLVQTDRGISRTPPVSPRDADAIFRRIMREGGTDFVTRWLVWTGVRWGALGNKARRAGFLRDLPLVLLVSVLVLPVLLLPAPLGRPVLRIVSALARLVGLR